MNEEVKEDRTCANCACYFEQSAEGITQGFCRRTPPLSQEMAVEVPRMDRNGQPMMGKNDKPLMDRAQKLFYVFPPTLQKLVCFDGWRPADTLPGESWERKEADKFLRVVKTVLEPLTANMMDGMERLRRDMLMDELADPTKKN